MNILYFSNRSKPCIKLMTQIEKLSHIRTNFKYISIDTSTPSHPIKSVPAIVVNDSNGKQTIFTGKKAFEWLENESNMDTLPPFELGFGTNNFSMIEGDSIATNNYNYTYIEEQSEVSNNRKDSQIQGKKSTKIGDSALDDLMKQRSNDIPMPLSRS